jgi:hypothetical protein
MNLDIELGEFVVFNNASVGKIPQRRLIDDVSHREALDSLVLGRLAGAAIAKNLPRVVATMTVTSMVTPLNLR